jgi:hypothetical protein
VELAAGDNGINNIRFNDSLLTSNIQLKDEEYLFLLLFLASRFGQKATISFPMEKKDQNQLIAFAHKKATILTISKFSPAQKI